MLGRRRPGQPELPYPRLLPGTGEGTGHHAGHEPQVNGAPYGTRTHVTAVKVRAGETAGNGSGLLTY